MPWCRQPSSVSVTKTIQRYIFLRNLSRFSSPPCLVLSRREREALPRGFFSGKIDPPTSRCLSGIWRGALRGASATYGRSPKKPTVGRLDDPQWVARTTYRRSLNHPSEGGYNSLSSYLYICILSRSHLPKESISYFYSALQANKLTN